MTVIVNMQVYPNLTSPSKLKNEVILENVDYASTERMNFGTAIQLVNLGYFIARHSWNAPGQFVCRILPGNAMHLGFPMQPCLGLKNAQGNMQPGWVPSQGDMFATDWYIVEVSSR